MNVVLRVHGLHACDKLRKSHASVRKYLLQRAVECGYSIYRLERLFGGGLVASSLVSVWSRWRSGCDRRTGVLVDVKYPFGVIPSECAISDQ